MIAFQIVKGVSREIEKIWKINLIMMNMNKFDGRTVLLKKRNAFKAYRA